MRSQRQKIAIVTAIGAVQAVSLPGSPSTSCSTFLNNFDADPAIQACLSPALSAVSQFDPSDSASSGANITSALGTLCQASNCPEATWSQTLSTFATNCSSDLQQGGNAAVQNLYDLVYLIYPFTQAVCSSDSSTGEKCILSITSTGSGGLGGANATVSDTNVASTVSNGTAFNVQTFVRTAIGSTGQLYSSLGAALRKRATGGKLFRRDTTSSSAPYSQGTSSGAVWSSTASNTASAAASQQSQGAAASPGGASSISVPNSSTWTKSGLAYLFLNGQMPTDMLCSPCSQSVLATYVAYFNQVPYARGVPNSPTLSGITSLWTSVGTKCGSNTLDQINQQAGTPNTPQTGSASGRLAAPIGLSLLGMAFYLF